MYVVCPVARHDMCQMRVHVYGFPFRTVFRQALQAHVFRVGQGRARWCGVVSGAFESLHQTGEVYVAVGKEDGVVGSVEARCEPPRVVRGVGAEAFRLSQYVVSERVSAEHHVLELVVYQFGR